jgi:hypothetical protein
MGAAILYVIVISAQPENCSLNSPRVNDVIWNLCIDSFGRSLDVKLQSIQKLLLKGLTPIVAAANSLLTAGG